MNRDENYKLPDNTAIAVEPVLANVDLLTRNDVVPFYAELIKSNPNPNNEEVLRVNNLILSKWSNSGLIYIKEKAWKKLKS
jgi:hypothetical protein